MPKLEELQCSSIYVDAVHTSIVLTFDLQNLLRSSVGASEYSLSVLSTLLTTNEQTGQQDSPKT